MHNHNRKCGYIYFYEKRVCAVHHDVTKGNCGLHRNIEQVFANRQSYVEAGSDEAVEDSASPSGSGESNTGRGTCKMQINLIIPHL